MELVGLSASAQSEEPRPVTEFGRIAAAIDEAEGASWDRVGGPCEGDTAAVARLDGELRRHRPAAAADWEWLARRLARAVANDWAPGFVNPLLRLAG